MPQRIGRAGGADSASSRRRLEGWVHQQHSRIGGRRILLLLCLVATLASSACSGQDRRLPKKSVALVLKHDAAVRTRKNLERQVGRNDFEIVHGVRRLRPLADGPAPADLEFSLVTQCKGAEDFRRPEKVPRAKRFRFRQFPPTHIEVEKKWQRHEV